LVEDLEDPRRSELLKCEGVDRAGLVARPVATSLLSLHGLVRHMADVERNWFTRVLLRAPDTRPLFLILPWRTASWSRSMTPTGSRTWRCGNRSARAAATTRPASRSRYRAPAWAEVLLRWIYVHMIEEYARHNGHADLIREMVDGAVGWRPRPKQAHNPSA
jgi:hypothetical protein